MVLLAVKEAHITEFRCARSVIVLVVWLCERSERFHQPQYARLILISNFKLLLLFLAVLFHFAIYSESRARIHFLDELRWKIERKRTKGSRHRLRQKPCVPFGCLLFIQIKMEIVAYPDVTPFVTHQCFICHFKCITIFFFSKLNSCDLKLYQIHLNLWHLSL